MMNCKKTIRNSPMIESAAATVSRTNHKKVHQAFIEKNEEILSFVS